MYIAIVFELELPMDFSYYLLALQSRKVPLLCMICIKICVNLVVLFLVFVYFCNICFEETFTWALIYFKFLFLEYIIGS